MHGAPQHHLTYIRDSDRTRVIFILEGELADCVQRAIEQAPLGFRLAALKADHTGRIAIRADGDDY